MALTRTLEDAETLVTKAPVFATTERADTNFEEPYTPNIGYPPFPYTAFIYEVAAGAVVLEYTANMEYPVCGNT